MLLGSATWLITLFIISDVQCNIPQPSETFTHSAVLASGNLTLYWMFTDTHITFEIYGKTAGWVGIGFSPNGAMTDSDIILGWVANGRVIVKDMHAVGQSPPIADPEQNVNVISGHECNGWTVLKFSRQLAACENKYDREISTNTMRLIWALGSTDPQGEVLARKHYHWLGRGAQSMHLLESPNRPKGNLPSGPTYKTLDIAVSDFTIPPRQTYYNCRLFKVPDFQKKHHIVKIEPIVQQGNEEFVHHMLIYRCGDIMENTTEVGINAPCYTTDMAHFETCTAVIIAWATGGGHMVYPDNAGLSMGDEDDPVYIQLETHYDNPSRKEGIIDSSGIRMTYTDTLRKHDVGVLYVGNAVIPTQHFIPPGAKDFVNVGLCYPECLEKGMDVTGVQNVTIFSVLLHSHIAGRSLKLRHIRNGTELPYLANDRTYDFNYQEQRQVDPPVTLLPTDTLWMECVYDTTGRKEMTEGGFGTREEMCISFVSYYPKIDTAHCSSSVSAYRTWPYFGIDLTQLRYNEKATGLRSMFLAGPRDMAGKTLMDVLSGQNWTEEAIDEFEEYYIEVEQQSICVPFNRSKSTLTELPTPKIKTNYTAIKRTCSAEVMPLSQTKDAMRCSGDATPKPTPSPQDSTTSGAASFTISATTLVFLLCTILYN
uniref:DBH-like monooxygenase protein 1 homolog n=1 Tax=Styela clava TaxID=7725 RepID=UPI00193AC1C2|nr:DBH-like monooxygenase protein 1 homolog [Styela clava]